MNSWQKCFFFVIQNGIKHFWRSNLDLKSEMDELRYILGSCLCQTASSIHYYWTFAIAYFTIDCFKYHWDLRGFVKLQILTECVYIALKQHLMSPVCETLLKSFRIFMAQVVFLLINCLWQEGPSYVQNLDNTEVEKSERYQSKIAYHCVL